MSSDDKVKPLNRAALFRRIILGLFPVIAIIFRSWIGVVVESIISLLAIVLDRPRNQRQALHFVVYLIAVWTIQAISLGLVLSLAGEPVFHMNVDLQDAEAALEKWNELDSRVDLTKETWPETDYPWIKEFPPLGPSDPVPVIRTASVILAAHNEHQYLERTINSILAESDPAELLEIIVIDDASEPPLSTITDQMISSLSKEKVKVVRQLTREGLIRSKSHGAAIAKGDLVIFLDAHVKPEKNWLAPLFKHTNENWKRVVVPVIPILNGDKWKVESTAVGYKMMFDWSLGFNWFDDGNDWVPIMSGGLLAITRRYWHWSGEYDNGMLQWGGENIEQSIRIWLCGGEIVVARDSRVSHVFRPNFPYAINHTQVNVNKVRLAEVWLDDYKNFFYRSDPYAKTLVTHMGDVSERLRLKEKLHCKPFQFFVDRFRSVFDSKYMLPTRHFAIKDEVSGKCIEAVKDGSMRFGECLHAQGNAYSPSYRFVPDSPSEDKSSAGVLRSMQFPNLCFDANAASLDKKGLKIILYHCMAKNDNQRGWVLKDGGLRWNDSCAGIDSPAKHLVFGDCVEKDGEFLGKRFYGHPDHRFVALDEQRMEAAKSDKDIKRPNPNESD